MKIIIKNLDDDLDCKETHIIYVRTNDDVNVEAVMCSEVELEIYTTKYKNKYDIEQVVMYEI